MKATLALDLGTRMGFALWIGGVVKSGGENFSPKANEPQGQRFAKFLAWLREIHARYTFDSIAYEEVIGHGPGAQAAHVYGGFIAVMMMFADARQIPYEGFHVGTIKKAWTGNGAAKKPEMIARCKALGFDPATDNEADAIALIHLATNRIPSLPLELQMQRFKRKPRPNADARTAAIPYDPF